MPYFNDIHLTTGGSITADGKQAEPIEDHADPSSATAEDIAAKQNEILAALRAVGIIQSS
ncbi:hypothetical protein [Gracilibacillus lacisalsi]|uniref:hypothetical protein n=1 Tax=Gracilibacillus lacisalsi TaxID=393087 RepID=UPI00037AAB9D|nr:hypothetical protein [Gracilibacillus lacisalsi]